MKIFLAFIVVISSALGSNDVKFRSNGLLLYKQSSDHSYDDTFQIQNLSLNIESKIDDSFTFSTTLDLKSEFNQTTGEREIVSDISELYVKTSKIDRLDLYFGKFYQGISLLNTLRPQHRPFVFQTTMQKVSFGENGLNETGASLQYRLETAGFSYIHFQAFNSQNEIAFKDAEQNSIAYLLAYSNVNQIDQRKSVRTKFSGTVADKKNASAGTVYMGAEVSFFDGNMFSNSTDNNQLFIFNYLYTARQLEAHGYYNSVSVLYKYNIKKNIYSVGYENIGMLDDDKPVTQVATGQYGHRFSKKMLVRLQYKYEKESYQDENHQFGLQMNFSLGDEYTGVSY